MGSELCVVPVRGCATLTRGYRKCDPYGVGSLAALHTTPPNRILGAPWVGVAGATFCAAASVRKMQPSDVEVVSCEGRWRRGRGGRFLPRCVTKWVGCLPRRVPMERKKHPMDRWIHGMLRRRDGTDALFSGPADLEGPRGRVAIFWKMAFRVRRLAAGGGAAIFRARAVRRPRCRCAC